MGLPHEDAAKGVYPSARKFEAVHLRGALTLKNYLVGWTFEADKENSSADHYAWISAHHEITSDPRATRTDAARSLRSYARNAKQIIQASPDDPKEAV